MENGQPEASGNVSQSVVVDVVACNPSYEVSPGTYNQYDPEGVTAKAWTA